MAVAIVANALTVHTGIAGAYDIRTLDELRGARGRLLKSKVLETWRYILDEINYWPIFKIASDVLLPIPNGKAQAMLDRLHLVAGELDGIGVTSTQDMAGQMFGRLIADRKFLATFYTLPASAALLADLAVSKLDVDWSNPDALTGLRIADLACGTGVLLSAAYRAVAARHRRSGGDDAAVHRSMMESALVGADIMPAATHLTASMLSSAHPTVTFGNTQVYTMPYGREDEEAGGGIAIGSLDLIESDRMLALFSTGPRIVRGKGEDAKAKAGGEDFRELVLPPQSADLVIMNPPFTTSTSHEGEHAVPRRSFAGFATSADEQEAMSKALRGIRSRLIQPAGDGNAGLGSNFIDLAHQKLKPGGVLALVLQLPLVSGPAWSGARSLLASHYCDLNVITIAAAPQSATSFSADTGEGEALIVAVKRDVPKVMDETEADTIYVSLRKRPESIVEAVELTHGITALPSDLSGLIRSGNTDSGCFIRATLANGGCASLREPAIATTARALEGGELCLPRVLDPISLSITRLTVLGQRGLVDRDINGTNSDGTPRGPFKLHDSSGSSTYPVLWAHAAQRERRLIVDPDKEGRVRPGCDAKAIAVFATATRLHFTRLFRLNSQSLAACLTPEPTIGGQAWPNFNVEGDARREEALVLWANTTLGLLLWWWLGNRQQLGRANLPISALPSLPVFDVRTLNARQLRLAAKIFADFRDWTFLPANEAYRDETRKALDRAVLCDLLGLPESILEPLDMLRRQWCAEATVHGGKSTRPK